MNSIRLVLAHELGLIRSALRGLLAAEPDFAIVAEADSAASLQEAVRRNHFNVVVLSISARAGLGTSILEWLREHAVHSRVVVTSPRDEASFARLLLSAGATAFVCEQSSPSVLLQAIRESAAGRNYLDPQVSELERSGSLPAVRRGGGRSGASFLSKRETEVLKLLAQGLTNQQVADALKLSVKTAETYRVRLTKKLGVKTRAELFRYAFDIGMIGPDQLGGAAV